MTAAGAFGMVGVYAAIANGGKCILNKTGFIERIGVDRNLYIVRLRH